LRADLIYHSEALEGSPLTQEEVGEIMLASQYISIRDDNTGEILTEAGIINDTTSTDAKLVVYDWQIDVTFICYNYTIEGNLVMTCEIERLY
jgi:hypothetical protein